jgi:hypothetical protein
VKPVLKPEHYQIFELYALRQIPVSQVAEIIASAQPGFTSSNIVWRRW